MNSSLSLKISPNGGSGSRFLVFSICLVANLTHCRCIRNVGCICDYQLTVADGGYEKFESTTSFLDASESEKCTGDHVLVLSSIKMVKRDKNYEEASFEFYIRNWDYKEEAEAEKFFKKWTKRSFRHDGEEGDGCPKRLK
ncbi:hypothetical protein Gotri_004950 [Gossypium trilobum]|uniref:Uncharacterized protein n=1 Tax=Gossypium trilobum TaxID=34281 RepID=A0A7J9F6I5_9ROSI|nr:hypothetical protein [Gossypium trilobum]